MCHTLTAVSVTVSALAVKPGGGSDLHLQLFAFGGVGWHGVAVVRPQTALALSPHRLGRLIGCVRAGAPAAQTLVLQVAKNTHIILTQCCHGNKFKKDTTLRGANDETCCTCMFTCCIVTVIITKQTWVISLIPTCRTDKNPDFTHTSDKTADYILKSTSLDREDPPGDQSIAWLFETRNSQKRCCTLNGQTLLKCL